jgi:hypothetical protein
VRPDWQDLVMAPVLAVDGTVFATVLFGVVAVGVVVAAVLGLRRRGFYDHVGAGGLWAADRGPAPPPADDRREEEIQQMQDALRARRPAAAHPPAERSEPGDPALAEELRQLAVARNARRRAQGLEPLDVDAEVARRLREL